MTKNPCARAAQALLDVVEAQIVNYEPAGLGAERWVAVADQVRALVRGGEPTSVTDARQCLGALVGFLSWAEDHLGWQPLEALLTADNVARYDRAQRGVLSDATREAKRTRLARSIRVMAGDPARTKRSQRKMSAGPYTPDELTKLRDVARTSLALAAALAASDPTTSLPAGAAAAARAAGIELSRPRLRAAHTLALLEAADDTPAVLRRADITRAALDDVLGHLPAPAPELRAELLRGATPTASVIATHRPASTVSVARAHPRAATTGGHSMRHRPPSAAQVRRSAQAHRQAAAAREPLPESFTSWLNASYEPRGLPANAWPAIRPLVLEVLLRSEIRGTASLRNRTSDVTHFASWCHARGLVLDAQVLMQRVHIDEYIRLGMPGADSKRRSDRRARLRSIADTINPSVDKLRVESLPRKAVRPPYSDAEMVSVRRAALIQSTPEKSRQLALCIGLGAGAGIDSSDLKRLKREHLTVGEEGIRIDVPGARGRTVWVLAGYEPLVVRGLEGVAVGQYVLGDNPDRANVAGQVFERADWWGDLPHLEQGRLRVTWLATHLLAATPLRVLCDAAGLASTRTLFDLLPMLPDTGASDASTMLRGGEHR